MEMDVMERMSVCLCKFRVVKDIGKKLSKNVEKS